MVGLDRMRPDSYVGEERGRGTCCRVHAPRKRTRKLRPWTRLGPDTPGFQRFHRKRGRMRRSYNANGSRERGGINFLWRERDCVGGNCVARVKETGSYWLVGQFFSLFCFLVFLFFRSWNGRNMRKGWYYLERDIGICDEKGEQLRIDIIARILKMKHTIWSEQYRFYERS